MTAAEYQKCCKLLNYSSSDVAKLLKCSERTARAWGSGDLAIPQPVGDWIAECAYVHHLIKYPKPPKNWRVRLDKETVS